MEDDSKAFLVDWWKTTRARYEGYLAAGGNGENITPEMCLPLLERLNQLITEAEK